MRKKIAWITDSALSLSKEYCEENHIYIVPLNVIFGQKSYRDGVDITTEEFYTKLKESQTKAKTSQPIYGDFIELYTKLKKDYDYAIAIHASSALTGTYQSSSTASVITEFPNVEVIDSKIGDYCLKYMVQKGVELEKEGKCFEEIVETLRTLPEQTNMYILPASLEQLKKSGRVSSAQKFASLLNIKLIIKFDDGKVVVDEKIRSDKKAKAYLSGKIEEAYKRGVRTFCFSHAKNKEVVESWKKELIEKYREITLLDQYLVPVAGVHAGFGTIAISWMD
ncbi:MULTISPECIES: DegV family protein [Bacillus]|uniref:DegV family protein n=1 Tax=Bacillus TaxID=1386 RepID=UPI000300A903|nr:MULTISPECIES: DegV family protein [Bacillus]